MTMLNWRDADEVCLAEPLVPDPQSPSRLLKNLNQVRVAFDNGLVHIDPRHPGGQDPDPANDVFTVYVVSAASVRSISYAEPKVKRTSKSPSWDDAEGITF